VRPREEESKLVIKMVNHTRWWARLILSASITGYIDEAFSSVDLVGTKEACIVTSGQTVRSNEHGASEQKNRQVPKSESLV
jgi:hypothetical protein